MFRFLVSIPIYFYHLFGTEYNHPEFKWSTIETEHFLIHFHEETVVIVHLKQGAAKSLCGHGGFCFLDIRGF